MVAVAFSNDEISLPERIRMFDAVHANTHRDFKGTYNGEKTILSYAKYGFGLVSAQSISAAELRDSYSKLRHK